MDFLEKIKLGFIAFFTLLTSCLGTVAIPFYMLVGANVIDYITGIGASIYRGEAVQSYRGFRGIAKKVCMWLLVAVGFALDYILMWVGAGIDIDIGIKSVVALAVVFWLLANETISILENIADIGTPLPPFLMEIVKALKIRTEEQMNIEKKDRGGH